VLSLKRSTVCVSLLILLLAAASAVFAQTGTSEVNGTVTDPTGGVLPGITVKLINQGTQLVDQRPTNGTGYFVFVNVKPGTYIIRVEAPGYKTTTTSPFQVQVNETLTQEVKLVVGQVTETVEVHDTAALIEKTTTELGTVIDEKTVEELPLNGRNFTQLLTLTPGVTPVSTAQNKSVGCCEGNVGLPGSGFSDASFHGQQNRSKLYYYDGIINTNVRGPTYIVIPNVDLIQEFKIVGHDAKAEYGGASGGVVNVVSKSGTDSFHASAFEFLRNDYFDARDSFVDGKCVPGRGGCSTPGAVVPKAAAPYRQNQFGVVVTGPIIKHRTFFAFGYDGWRYSKADGNLSYVPTQKELAGDFTLGTATNGIVNPSFYGNHQLYNPYSTRAFGGNFLRDPFFCANGGNGNPLPLLPGQTVQVTPNPSGTTPTPAGAGVCNRIPQALISQPMLQFFQTYAPRPNLFDPSIPNSNFIRTRPTRNESNAYSIRIDHRFRDADNLFFRYTEQRNHVFNPIGDVGDSQGGSQGRNYGADWVHSFSPNMILDVRGGVADRPGVDAGQQNEHPKGVAGLNQLGFLSTSTYHGLLIQTGGNNAWTSGGSADFGVRGAADRKNPDWSITPSLTWLKGNHNIKTGFMYIDTRRIQLNTLQRYSFDTGPTGLPSSPNTTGLQLATALLGFPTTFESQLPQPHGGQVKFKFAGWGAFVQDEWKIKPTITITAGLRYDYVTRVHTLDGRLWSAIDLNRQQYIVGSRPLQGCSVVGHAPCIPDAPVLPGFPNGFFSDPHFGNLVYANRSDFAPPPIKDNWGPRVGVAWSITPKTVLRAGYGLYWDSMTARSQWAQNELEALTWPDASAFSGNANGCANGSNCAFTVPANPNDPNAAHQIIEQQKLGFSTPLPSYVGPINGKPWNSGGFQNDPHYKDGYASEWNLEIQRELSAKMMVSAAYVGSHSGRLHYAGNANAATAPATCLLIPLATRTPCLQAQDLLRPMPWLTPSSNYARSIGYADYHALEARFQHRLSNGLSTLVSYTWSKSTDTTSGYFGSAESGLGNLGNIQNYADPKTAHGISGYDITHFLSWSALYELPFGKGKTWLQSGPASWIFGNWQTNYIFQARSGQPYNLGVSGDLDSLAGTFVSQAPTNYLRPNLLPGVSPFTEGPISSNPDPGCAKTISQGGRAADHTHTMRTWFNPCAFTTPPVGTFGTFGRNALRGPHVVNMDFGLTKNIRMGERFTLQFRAEAFNVFNIQNWDAPSQNSSLQINQGNNPVTIGTGTGQVTQLAQGTTARELQFGIKIIF